MGPELFSNKVVLQQSNNKHFMKKWNIFFSNPSNHLLNEVITEDIEHENEQGHHVAIHITKVYIIKLSIRNVFKST